MKEDSKASFTDRVHYPATWVYQIDRCNKCRSFNEPNNFMRSVETLLSSLFKPLREQVQQYINTLEEGDDYKICILVYEKIIDVLQENGYLKAMHRQVESGSDNE